MVHRKGLLSAAACAALACAGIVQAGPNSTPSDDGLTLRPVFLDAAPATSTAPTTDATAPASAPATPPKPLMGLLEKAGIGKPLEDLNISIGGYIDGGYTVGLLSKFGTHTGIGGRFQDGTNNKAKLDQADFYVDKSVDYSKSTPDVGGHFEVIYGHDTNFFHSSGIFDNANTLGVSKGYYGATNPDNQFDINQAYIDVAIPVGTGLRIRVGKFDTLLGYEGINPTGNAFYSHSFLFTYAVPLTQTGVMGEYKITPDVQIDAGFTRGWNQSLTDNNGEPDFLGELTITPQESDFLKKLTVVANLSFGPQGTGDNSDYWTVIDLIAKFQALGDGSSAGSLLVAVNADYGDAPHAIRLSDSQHTPGLSDNASATSAEWFGMAAYGQYICGPHLTLNVRAEWYDDAAGFTTAGLKQPALAGTVTMYEATLGVAITPFPDDVNAKNLVIRPEVRLDYANRPANVGFEGGHNLQATLGIDAYFVY
jgi:hypothetical protein